MYKVCGSYRQRQILDHAARYAWCSGGEPNELWMCNANLFDSYRSASIVSTQFGSATKTTPGFRNNWPWLRFAIRILIPDQKVNDKCTRTCVPVVFDAKLSLSTIVRHRNRLRDGGTRFGTTHAIRQHACLIHPKMDIPFIREPDRLSGFMCACVCLSLAMTSTTTSIRPRVRHGWMDSRCVKIS